MVYINRKALSEQIETVDEFTTTKEAREMVREYRMSDRSAHYYTSSRSTQDWRNRS